MFILYNLVRVGNKFSKIKMKIGDIQTNNILLNEDGKMKLINIDPCQAEVFSNGLTILYAATLRDFNKIY